MKYTQGKWNLFIQAENGFGITNGESVIAIAGEVDLPQNEANAHLIASAPEMLGALKGALKYLKDALYMDGHTTELLDTYEIIKSAIVKAEGK